MPETEIPLADDEDIIRVFLRRPNEPWGFSKLRKADFARQMSNHSGMSMLRLKYLEDRQEALNWFKSDKLKGLAICKAKQMKGLGLHFMASSPTAKHISVRCPPCDVAVNYPILCKPETGDHCLINRRAPVMLSQQLYEIFGLDTPVVLNR
jgi:hypothetical protein